MVDVLDDILPDHRYRIAASIVIPAPQERIWEELLALPLRALPMSLALTRIRHLPAVLTGKEPAATSDTTFLDSTPIPVVVNDPPERIILVGLSQPWKLQGGAEPPYLNAVDLARWSSPGWIKVAMEFRLVPQRDGILLSTETRIAATDEATGRAFAPYWMAIRGSSARMRREVLRKTAERSLTP